MDEPPLVYTACTATYLVCCEEKDYTLFLSSTGTREGERNLIKGEKMDVELIPTPDVPSHQDASVDATPVPSANRLCVITRPTHRQLSMLLFDFQLYFSLLKTAALGRTVLYSPVMSSTQNVFSGNLSFANLLPQALGTICVAEQQTKGKGRSGAWVSPKGCMMFSLLLKFGAGSRLHRDLTMLIYVVQVAMVSAVKEIPGYEVIPLHIKWPNDIYTHYEGELMKLGGKIIDPLASSAHNITIANVGCGLNVSNSHPTVSINDVISEVNQKCGSSLKPLRIEQVLALTLNKLELCLAQYEARGLSAVEQVYYKYWLHSGSKVRLSTQSHDEEVEILGLDYHGYLRVRTVSTGEELSLKPRAHKFDVYRGIIMNRLPQDLDYLPDYTI